METEWRVARAQLRELIQEKPQIGHEEAAIRLGYSITWVCKWRKRFNENRTDETVVNSQPHRPKHISHQVPVVVEERIIALRLSLTEHYNRKVGPRTIAAYLKREKDSLPAPIPTSSATIWRILRRRQYILPPVHEQKNAF